MSRKNKINRLPIVGTNEYFYFRKKMKNWKDNEKREGVNWIGLK